MLARKKPNENQTGVENCYRFAEFELHPGERLLRKNGRPAPLTPKAFDALVLFVRRAGRLVTKKELIRTLWPDTFVTEANLTNIVGALRRVTGRDAICTVSKHGYRFALPVEGEPGIRAELFRRFVQARELTQYRSLPSVTRARGLYWQCIAEEPGFAPAWAWLGRCCWFRAKFGATEDGDFELAHAAFRRAFVLDPDLACAHQFYTPVEADSGQARSALLRLGRRLQVHPDEPETLAGLVQTLRFCGLLDPSAEAAARAQSVDPATATSVAHTRFAMGDFAGAIECYGSRAGYYLDAASWAALGNLPRALALLAERLARAALSPLIDGLMRSLLDIASGRRADALDRMGSMEVSREPEVLFYLARHYSFLGAADSAVAKLEAGLDAGFVCAPSTLLADPWLQAVREHERFRVLLERSRSAVREAEVEWAQFPRAVRNERACEPAR